MGMANVRWVVDGSAVSTAIIPILGNADGIRDNAPAFPGQTPATREFEARLKEQLGSMPQGRPSVYDLMAMARDTLWRRRLGQRIVS
jgi:branched-chain amino acid transport system substrate-binding protein